MSAREGGQAVCIVRVERHDEHLYFTIRTVPNTLRDDTNVFHVTNLFEAVLTVRRFLVQFALGESESDRHAPEG
ncbi:hypothetical protein [Actinomycetospora lemnae]|uniref:Uncharacterized protein n=1 Tax=Actinomycetospora lemnae TaxID=3019891 RepID=A0ABT5SRM9_9PSEU|nr:hypothetical protein [Actinomycetospora sp. DW7H6]MDD7965498.1 hypothetical protein [Actinomycetospora sp. DW7H6]